MKEISLTYPTPEGSKEIPLDGEKLSFGRGSESDFRFADDGLSRLHATVYREGDRIWIVDENSTNGSFINGEKVGGSGASLKNGDTIKIGHFTNLKVRIVERQLPNQSKPDNQKLNPVSAYVQNSQNLLPFAVIAAALFVVFISAIFIGTNVLGDNEAEIAARTPDEPEFEEDSGEKDNKIKEKKTTPTATPEKSESGNKNSETIDAGKTIEVRNDSTSIQLPKGKYQDMSDADKDRYIAAKAEKVALLIGNQKSTPIPPEAVREIKKYVNGYASRLNKSKKDSCEQGSWISSDFTSVMNRAARTSGMVVRNFRAEGIEPIIGIYVAMIEGEHCPCLTSTTGAKGMFQFLASSAPDYGLAPDQRCEPELSAKAGAKYLKSLIARYGTAPDSVPLAIASFNSGQGHLSKNLDRVLSETIGQNRNFWTLTANQKLLEGRAGEQFKGENVKYVPKFFATAIIGENPPDFGVNLQPLSTYTK